MIKYRNKMYTLVLDGNEYSMQQITMNSHSNNSNVWTTDGWVNPSNLWLPPPPRECNFFVNSDR